MKVPEIILLNGQSFINSIELHNETLELNHRNYAKTIKLWFYEADYLFQSEQLIRFPIKGKDFDYYGKLSSGGRPISAYLISLELSKLIAVNSKSKFKQEYVQWLLSLEKKVEEFDLLTHEQILVLSKIKSFFCYVDNQIEYEKKHIDKIYKESNEDKFAVIEFQKFRNKVLDIEPKRINELIKSYCIEHQKSFPKNASKREMINILDSYDGLKNAVWDFLNIKGQVNSIKLANLVKQMAITDGSIILSKNEDNLFQTKKQVELPESIKALTA